MTYAEKVVENALDRYNTSGRNLRTLLREVVSAVLDDAAKEAEGTVSNGACRYECTHQMCRDFRTSAKWVRDLADREVPTSQKEPAPPQEKP